MPLLNPRFDDAGALPGDASRWTLSAMTSLEAMAGFGSLGREGFEDWTAFLGELTDVTVARAFFGSDGFEAFENAWAGSAFLFELPTGRLVTCTFGSAATETWNLATPLLDAWATVPSIAGITENFVRPDFVDDWTTLASEGLPTETFSGTWTLAVTL